MKVAPVSADLLVKIGLAVAVLGAGYYVFKRVSGAVHGTDAINPTSDKNIVYQAANSIVKALTGQDETLGGWLYSVTHADPMAGPAPVSDYALTPIPYNFGIDPNQSQQW